MSIPPLVCSTPPPPDQCEEDKDPGDFDIPYNLSQDDDDDDSFGYGDFSSYNHYQSNCVAQEKETKIKNEKEYGIQEQVDVSDKNQSDSTIPHSPETTDNEIKPKNEEDTNIEDLCLEVNELSISSSEKDEDPSEAENLNVINSENVLDVRRAPDINEISSSLSRQEIPENVLDVRQAPDVNKTLSNLSRKEIPENVLDVRQPPDVNETPTNLSRQEMPKKVLEARQPPNVNETPTNLSRQEMPEIFLEVRQPPNVNETSSNLSRQEIPENFLEVRQPPNVNETSSNLSRQEMPENFLEVRQPPNVNETSSNLSRQEMPENFLEVRQPPNVNETSSNLSRQEIPENFLGVRQPPDVNETPSNLSRKEIAAETNLTDHCKEISDDGVDELSIDLDNHSSEPNFRNDEVCKNYLNIEDEPAKESSSDDAFGDFDDFQFASAERKTSEVIENCDNPWDTNTADDNDFGNFTANFESTEQKSANFDTYDQEQKDNIDEHDDFGDFDDFKSSAIDNDVRELCLESGSDQSLPVLNFHASDSEHQVMESITKVLTSVFEEEISEPEIEFEGRLETMLSETWRHLRETDVRQPYIINWNNSLGQKTLLRALCIDSRNILFGPKWGYNMPKYAVNLSAAPLQPQKPLTSSQSEPVAERNTPKSSQGGWTDPFTADGQESCNTESESVVEVTTTDLDVFEATISTKPEKIYSSTLNVQPLRQISLPDTHIFTPTDSETPTSKTVHYDSGPPILLPQNTLEGKQADSSTTLTNDSPKDKDDDYWDFQDFKSSTDKSAPAVPASLPDPLPDTKIALNPSVTYQTQVLQPIRMEPLMPTVNWPDPGEIKETFDDFSDFVSNSAWSDKPREETSTPATENKSTVETDVLDKINDKHKNMEEVSPKHSDQDFDDDFDTFQSALPPKDIAPEFHFDSLGTFNNIPLQNSTQIADFQNAFPKNNVKSEIISVSNSKRPNEALTVNQGTLLSASSKISPASSNAMHPNLLQPMPTSSNSSQNKQKTGQILQPLSLESYSQINWPNPGIDLQDLSRFNPVETLQSLKSDLSVCSSSKGASPVHNQKNAISNQATDDDWGEFVSSKPKQQASVSKKPASFVDDDEWTDFVSSTSIKPQNGLNTISLNVHTNSNIQKSSNSKYSKNNQLPLDIPTLNYITPKTSGHSSYNDRHFQNL